MQNTHLCIRSRLSCNCTAGSCPLCYHCDYTLKEARNSAMRPALPSLKTRQEGRRISNHTPLQSQESEPLMLIIRKERIMKNWIGLLYVLAGSRNGRCISQDSSISVEIRLLCDNGGWAFITLTRPIKPRVPASHLRFASPLLRIRG